MKRKNLVMYLLLAVALLIIALPLAGCAGSGSTAATAAAETTIATMTAETTATGTTTPATTAAETTAAETTAAGGLTVSIKSNAFNPDSLTIKVGDTVTWTNNDSYAHTVTSDNGAFDSGSMAGGATFSFTFKTAGTYNYVCSIHTFMTAKIIVQ